MRSPGPSQNPSNTAPSASRLPGLCSHLRGKVGGAFLHALAQHVSRKAPHLRSHAAHASAWHAQNLAM